MCHSAPFLVKTHTSLNIGIDADNGRKTLSLELMLLSLTIPVVTTSIAFIMVKRINKK